MDLRQTFVLANEFKEGDQVVGGLDDTRVREDARQSIRRLTVALSLWYLLSERRRFRGPAFSA